MAPEVSAAALSGRELIAELERRAIAAARADALHRETVGDPDLNASTSPAQVHRGGGTLKEKDTQVTKAALHSFWGLLSQSEPLQQQFRRKGFNLSQIESAFAGLADDPSGSDGSGTGRESEKGISPNMAIRQKK